MWFETEKVVRSCNQEETFVIGPKNSLLKRGENHCKLFLGFIIWYKYRHLNEVSIPLSVEF